MKKETKGHLTRDERGNILMMRKSGKSFREIAKNLDRSHSSILRELKRNSVPAYLSIHGSIREKADWMNEKAQLRQKKREKSSKLELEQFVAKRILSLLEETNFSPEYIADIISKDDCGVKLCGTTIRRWIDQHYPHYRQHFPHRGKRPRKSITPARSRKRKQAAPEKLHISQRPPEATLRQELGHLELDMVVCSQSTKAILSIRDRKTRYCDLSFVDNLKANTVRQAIIQFLNKHAPGTIKTMTFDRGTEFAEVYHLENYFQLSNYFCDAYCAWQKGSVENQNKELRRHVSKGTNLELVSEQQLERIQDLINAKPRVCLGGSSSFDAWVIEIKNKQLHQLH